MSKMCYLPEKLVCVCQPSMLRHLIPASLPLKRYMMALTARRVMTASSSVEHVSSCGVILNILTTRACLASVARSGSLRRRSASKRSPRSAMSLCNAQEPFHASKKNRPLPLFFSSGWVCFNRGPYYRAFFGVFFGVFLTVCNGCYTGSGCTSSCLSTGRRKIKGLAGFPHKEADHTRVRRVDINHKRRFIRFYASVTERYATRVHRP